MEGRAESKLDETVLIEVVPLEDFQNACEARIEKIGKIDPDAEYDNGFKAGIDWASSKADAHKVKVPVSLVQKEDEDN